MVGANIYWLGLDENVMYVKQHPYNCIPVYVESIAQTLHIQASSGYSKRLPMFPSVITCTLAF